LQQQLAEELVVVPADEEAKLDTLDLPDPAVIIAAGPDCCLTGPNCTLLQGVLPPVTRCRLTSLSPRCFTTVLVVLDVDLTVVVATVAVTIVTVCWWFSFEEVDCPSPLLSSFTPPFPAVTTVPLTVTVFDEGRDIFA
jgi:hypothetical protein